MAFLAIAAARLVPPAVSLLYRSSAARQPSSYTRNMPNSSPVGSTFDSNGQSSASGRLTSDIRDHRSSSYVDPSFGTHGSTFDSIDTRTYTMVGAIALMLLIFILYTPFLVIVSLAVLAGFIYANRTKNYIGTEDTRYAVR